MQNPHVKLPCPQWPVYGLSMDNVWRVYGTCTINLGSNSSIVSQCQDVSNNL